MNLVLIHRDTDESFMYSVCSSVSNQQDNENINQSMYTVL